MLRRVKLHYPRRGIPAAHPCRGARPGRVPHDRDRGACWAAQGELFGLRWRDVALDAGRLDVMRSYRLAPKSDEERHLSLHPELARILRRWRDDCPPTDDRLVFPVRDRNGDYRMGAKDDMRGLPALLRAAGGHVAAKPWHALRHTFASNFMMAGGNILTLQKLLGTPISR